MRRCKKCLRATIDQAEKLCLRCWKESEEANLRYNADILAHLMKQQPLPVDLLERTVRTLWNHVSALGYGQPTRTRRDSTASGGTLLEIGANGVMRASDAIWQHMGIAEPQDSFDLEHPAAENEPTQGVYIKRTCRCPACTAVFAFMYGSVRALQISKLEDEPVRVEGVN